MRHTDDATGLDESLREQRCRLSVLAGRQARPDHRTTSVVHARRRVVVAMGPGRGADGDDQRLGQQVRRRLASAVARAGVVPRPRDSPARRSGVRRAGTTSWSAKSSGSVRVDAPSRTGPGPRSPTSTPTSRWRRCCCIPGCSRTSYPGYPKAPPT